jgi:condensin complex subunit 2
MLAGDGSSIPFNTQFFHDDDDDGPGFDDGFDGDLAGTADPGEQDLLASTQGKTRRVRPEFIKYTKRAKRVDVRKLKENIWRGLKIPTPDEQPADLEAMVRDSPEKHSRMRTSRRTHKLFFGRTLTETRR